MKKDIYERVKYNEAKNFPGELEIRISVKRSKYRLQEALAVVWTLVNGERSVDKIEQDLAHLMDPQTVRACLDELEKIKLIGLINSRTRHR